MFKETLNCCAVIVPIILFVAGCATTTPPAMKTSLPPKAATKPSSYDSCDSYPSASDDFYQRLDEMRPAIAGIRNRVAIMPFGDLNGNVTDFGKYMAEEMITRLGNSRIELVERSLLNTALAELKLTNTDLFNQKSTKKFGELTGAGAILTGTVTDMGDAVRVNSRLIETDTGKILNASGVTITKTAAICKMMKSGITASSSGGPAAPSENGSKDVNKQDVFENDYLAVKIADIKRLKGGSLKVDIVTTYTNEGVIGIFLVDAQNNTYMVDENGNRAGIVKMEGMVSPPLVAGFGNRAAIVNSSKYWKEFHGSVPVKSSLVFDKVNPDAKSTILVTRYAIIRKGTYLSYVQADDVVDIKLRAELR